MGNPSLDSSKGGCSLSTDGIAGYLGSTYDANNAFGSYGKGKNASLDYGKNISSIYRGKGTSSRRK